MSEAERKLSGASAADWDDFPFDAQTILPDIPAGAVISALHVSVAPTPPGGSVILRGRPANGRTGSVRLNGRVYAAKLPFADGTIRIQYLGDTKAVHLNLESYVLA
jgi:hypothetical protein